MSVLVIRELDQEEIPAAAAVISAAFAPVSDQHGLAQGDDLAPLIARLEDGFRQEARQFGAWLEDRLVGYFSLDSKDEEVFEISRLCVHPEFQRRGYGQKLLDRAVAEIRWTNGVAAVCAVIGDRSPVLSWLTRNRFFVEVSGNVPGIPCPVCILQKDLPPEPGCSPNGCSGCGGSCR